MSDTLIQNDSSDRLFNIKSKSLYSFRVFMVFFFLIAFLISIGYWFYEIYTIYDTDIPDIKFGSGFNESVNKLTQIFHEATHSQVAFEAAILSFLLMVAAYRL